MAAGDIQFVRGKSLSKATTGARTNALVLPNCVRHNLREFHCRSSDESSGPIDPARSHLNVILRGFKTAAGVLQMAQDILLVSGMRAELDRANAAVGAEIVLSLPAATTIDCLAYFRDGVEFLERYFDAPILSSVVHFDQSHPHCHVIFLPIRGGKWCGGYFLGDKYGIKKMQAAFHEAVARRYGLRNGHTRESADIRQGVAAHMIDTIKTHTNLLNEPAVRQALLNLIAADPHCLRLAIEQSMSEQALIENLLTGNSEAPEIEKTIHYALLEHMRDDNSAVCDIGADHSADSVIAPLPSSESDTIKLDPFANDRVDASAGLCAIDGVIPVTTLLPSPEPITIAPDNTAIGACISDTHDPNADDYTRERDDFLASLWHAELGQPIAPSPPKPSRRAQMDEMVSLALRKRMEAQQSK